MSGLQVYLTFCSYVWVTAHYGARALILVAHVFRRITVWKEEWRRYTRTARRSRRHAGSARAALSCAIFLDYCCLTIDGD